MARIKIRRNFAFKDIKLTPGRDTMREVGMHLVERTVRRTKSGRDEDGRAFAPYQSGRPGPVDLHDTGQMLDEDYGIGMLTENRVGLGMATARSADIAEKHEQGHGNLPVRRFLGIPQSWVREVKQIIMRRLRL
jgi:hypothetical protein